MGIQKIIMGLRALLVSLACLGFTRAAVDYTGYQVLRVKVRDSNEAETLRKLQEDGLFDFWTQIRIGKHVDIMASPQTLGSLKKWLDLHSLSSTTMIVDVAPLMKQELENIGNSTVKEKVGHSMDWTSYHPLDEIYGWFDYLESTYDFIETESIGQSYEGQEMIVLKVCRGGCGNKPVMWIDSGIHAREWISPATGTWMLNEVVENDSAHPELTEKLDWYFLPDHNPDGYRKTRNSNRMWRKTTSHHSGDSCDGTDANRNWDYHWAEGGSSANSCSETYHGPSAFSEVETQNVRDYVLPRKDKIKFYQTLHSYSQFVLYPWGYTSSNCPGHDKIAAMASKANDAMYAVHGTRYTEGCIPCILYTASGTSLDWALGVAGIPYVYSIELRDTGHYGFLLPPEQIIPNSEEVWAFHKVAAEMIIGEFGGQQ